MTVCAGWLTALLPVLTPPFPVLQMPDSRRTQKSQQVRKNTGEKTKRPKVFHLIAGWGLEGAGCLCVLAAEHDAVLSKALFPKELQGQGDKYESNAQH